VSESKLTVKFKSGGTVKTGHGGYSLLTKGTVPSNRKHVLAYLIAARENIIADYGSEDMMSASQIIILDRAISKLGICRLMEEHAREQGIFVNGDLLPCLKASFLAFSNSLRRDLECLKDLKAPQIDNQRTLQDTIKAFDAEKEKANSEAETQDNE